VSRLSDNIDIAIANKRVSSNYSEYSFVRSNPQELTDYPRVDYKVDFKAVFGISRYISEELTYNKDILALILKDIKHKVVQEVFGEFRDPIHNITAQLYRREYDMALDSLNELEKQMFNV
jgi:hypothetical protein